MRSKHYTYQSIQLLRFIAALLVVCFHLNIYSSGYKGVDLFFVISGFVIYRSSIPIIGSGVKHALYFITKRLIRIFVPYWSVLLLIIFAGNRAMLTNGHSAWQQAVAVLLLPGHLPFFDVSWSLSFEIYFYFLFSIIIFFPSRAHLLKTFLFSALIITTLITLVYAIAPQIPNKTISFIAGHNLWEFLLGIAAAVLSPKLNGKSKTVYIVLFAITMAVFAGIHLEYVPVRNSAIYGLLAAISILLITRAEELMPFRVPHIFIILGNASYIIYLIHVPLTQIFFRYLAPGFITITIYIILTLALSVFIHLFYEKKVLNELNLRAARLIFGKPPTTI